MKKLKCQNCNKIIRNCEIREHTWSDKTISLVIKYSCPCGDKSEGWYPIPPGPNDVDIREYSQYLQYKSGIKRKIPKKKLETVDLKKMKDLYKDVSDDSFNKNLTKSNELLEKIAPNDIFGVIDIDDCYEINNLSGFMWRKDGTNGDKPWRMDINGVIMDHVNDKKQINKNKYGK